MNRRKFAAAAVAAVAAPRALAFDRYEMPAEAQPHTRTFMQWPVSVDVYGERLLARVQAAIAGIAQNIARFEEVVVLVGDDAAAEARAQLGGSVRTWSIPTDDLWCRDSGPTFVKNAAGQLAVAEIQFNGWGDKQAHDNDKLVARRVADRLGVPFLETGLVGEQGGLEHDGAGLVLAHASSWVNPNRNAGTADEVAEKIMAAVGGTQMIWAPGIIGADITDYHIDALARFVAPGKVLIQLPDEIDPDDPWSRAAHETHDILRAARTPDGNPLEIVRMPEPVATRSRKKDFVASYVNYYVCNGAVIGSEFGDARADGMARELFQHLYPGREIVMLNTDAIGESGGGIHCATQQQPVGGVA
ncbi:MAG: agmatine deiminase family protein [Phyllobacteriaceae bacterium]|nr:agmatine deiminase family protein [Phyllobacteriaceae bacterium]